MRGRRAGRAEADHLGVTSAPPAPPDPLTAMAPVLVIEHSDVPEHMTLVQWRRAREAQRAAQAAALRDARRATRRRALLTAGLVR